MIRPQLGQVINGKYRLGRLLGDGGMGSVFEAQHEKLGITVALKFLHAELSRKGGLVDRFLQEARASAQIRSPHVVRVTDVDQTPEGAAFIVLEYLEGRTLQSLYEDYHRTGQRLTYAEALDYAMQMIDGLEAAHASGVVHRDLKPENVMITRGSKGEAVLKLLDFGIAKLKVTTGHADKGLTRPGAIMGTPEYMAPEQAYAADAVDSRADVFSLGVIVFEMLAGRRPVGGEDPRTIANAYLAGQTARLVELVPNIAPELAEAVQRAMAPLAKDRFSTARAFREAIEPFADSARRDGPASHAAGHPPPSLDAGSSPVMPPVDVSAAAGAAGTIDDSLAAPRGEGGVARTWPPEGGEGADPAAAKAPGFDATRAMEPMADGPAGAPNGGMTALMPGLGAADAAASSASPRPAARPTKRRKRGMGVGTILIIAAALATAITALALALRSAGSSDDRRDPAPRAAAPPPMATVTAQPTQAPLQMPPPPPPPVPAPPPQTHPPAPPPGPGHPPAPRGTNPQPFPSAFPSGMPSGLPNGPFPPPTAPAPTTPPAPAIPGLPPLDMPPGIPTFPNPFPPAAPPG